MVELQNDKNETILTGFLHKSHIDENTEIEKIKKVKVKEINYFEQYPMLTAIQEGMSKLSNFNDVHPGDIIEGLVTKFIKKPL